MDNGARMVDVHQSPQSKKDVDEERTTIVFAHGEEGLATISDLLRGQQPGQHRGGGHDQAMIIIMMALKQ
jgi:hypothetical protein